MLGVATLIVVMAVMNGFRAQLIDKILGLNGHFIVQPMDSKLTDFDAVAARIAARARRRRGDSAGRGPGAGERRARRRAACSSAASATQDLPRVPGIANNVRLGTLENFERLRRRRDRHAARRVARADARRHP